MSEVLLPDAKFTVPAGSEADLRSYLRVLSRRRLIVVGCAALVLAGALAYSFVKKPTWMASAQVLVPVQSATSALNVQAGASGVSSDAAQRVMADDVVRATGEQVMSALAKQLGFRPSVTVQASATQDVLTFSASASSADVAAKVANAYAAVYITEARNAQVATYTGQVGALQTSIAALQAAEAGATGTQLLADQSSITTLTQSLQDLQAAGNLAGLNSGTVVRPAVAPTSPSSPKPLRNGLLGLVLGLLLGVGLAFMIDRLDDAVRSLEDVEAASGGLMVLGTVPRVDSWHRNRSAHIAWREDPNSPVSEAYRTLRTAVQFLSIEKPRKVIAITSAVPGEGKSTTVANLAFSLARAGQRVIAVSLDLRRPKLHTFFGVENTVGVTSVLLGTHRLKDTLMRVEGETNLLVLASGPLPPNPAELLSLDSFVAMVEDLSVIADVVLIDCPPTLPVTDTLLISRLVDGLIVLSRAGRTTKPNIARTVEMLNQVQAPVLGTVVNDVPAQGADSYTYGYGYGYRPSGPLLEDVGSSHRSADRSTKARAEANGATLRRKVPSPDVVEGEPTERSTPAATDTTKDHIEPERQRIEESPSGASPG